MKPVPDRPSRALLLLAFLSLVTGSSCAVTEEHINVQYVPESGITAISDAQRAVVRVEVNDQRMTKSHVGHKSNGYGMEMGQIIADNDIAQTVKNAVESELRDRGFGLGSDGSVVDIKLGKFENRFEAGIFAFTAVGEISMMVTVKRPNGSVVYTRNIHAQGVNGGVQIATGKNARIALEAALNNGIAELFHDPNFIGSLMHRAETPQTANTQSALPSAPATPAPATSAPPIGTGENP